MFWHFYFLTKTDQFAKAIAFAWARAFPELPDFKIALNSRIIVVFSNGFFAENNSNVLVESFFACFWHF